MHALRAASRRPTAPSRWTATASGSRTRPCPTAKLAAARPTAFSTVLRPARAAITCRPDGLGRTARRARRPASRRGSRAGRRSRRWAERRVGGHGPDLWGQSVSPPPVFLCGEPGRGRACYPANSAFDTHASVKALTGAGASEEIAVAVVNVAQGGRCGARPRAGHSRRPEAEIAPPGSSAWRLLPGRPLVGVKGKTTVEPVCDFWKPRVLMLVLGGLQGASFLRASSMQVRQELKQSASGLYRSSGTPAIPTSAIPAPAFEPWTSPPARYPRDDPPSRPRKSSATPALHTPPQLPAPRPGPEARLPRRGGGRGSPRLRARPDDAEPPSPAGTGRPPGLRTLPSADSPGHPGFRQRPRHDGDGAPLGVRSRPSSRLGTRAPMRAVDSRRTPGIGVSAPLPGCRRWGNVGSCRRRLSTTGGTPQEEEQHR